MSNASNTSNGDHDVVVLGAGYTGMLAAIRLAHRTRRTGVRITLVNPSERFTERLRMHQAATGQELAEHRIRDLLAGTGITFVRGFATAIDADARTVTVAKATVAKMTGDAGTAGPETAVPETAVLPYDTLVYALGSTTDTGRVPGADAHAFTLDGQEAAGRLAARLRAAEAAGGTVAVCGAGLTGVEAATEIAEAHPGLDVTLISSAEPGSMMGERARTHLNRALDRLGVTVITGAPVAKVLPDAVELATGETVPADVCLWTAGVRAPRLATDAGIETDERGLVVVDATLRSVSHPDIHAVGDAAAVRLAWGRLHGTCQSGLPTAQYTADTIAGLLRGRSPKPFRFGYVHQPVSLGRHDAVIQFTRADDTPRRAFLKGRAAVLYKEFVSGSPVTAYRLGKHVNVTATVSRGGRATRAAVA
ncbi:NAD(P)/FAD-dependent oxidoreductase [Streptomyces sp. NPDC058964]|uniref:NAD(P)/FAD-dependent oxidoreductase n=1 Tax=Streptomyces sp. NPDC058964 TaxID=3346681 RepID=UPI0036AF3186